MSNNTRAAPDYLIPIQDLIHSTFDEKRVFDAASSGEIELLFEVNDYLALLLLPNGGMNSPVGEPNPMRTPTHLVLETALCKRFKVKSSLPVQKASRGYLRGDEGIILRCLDASDVDNEAMPVRVNGIESPRPQGERPARWAFWGFHMEGKRQDYVVTKITCSCELRNAGSGPDERWIGSHQRSMSPERAAQRLTYPNS